MTQGRRGGASAGIGKAIARRLLREGWTVYGGARRVAQMADLAAGGARLLPLDVTDDASMRAAERRSPRNRRGFEGF